MHKAFCYILALCALSAIVVRGSYSRLQADGVGSTPSQAAEGKVNEPFDGADLAVVGAAFYEHDPLRMQLSAGIRVPQKSDCTLPPAFMAITFYSDDYSDRAERLQASCLIHGVCCSISRVPPDALGPDAPAGSAAFRRRLIANKPLFMLAAHAQVGASQSSGL